MKMPNFSKMTVDELISARATIDQLLRKRVPGARRELEERLDALNNFLGGESRRSRKSKANGRSKLRGRPVPPKYFGPNGETWAGRGLRPRWLTSAIKGGADLEDFAVSADGRRKQSKKAPRRRRKKRTVAKRQAPKRKAAKPPKGNTAASTEAVAA